MLETVERLRRANVETEVVVGDWTVCWIARRGSGPHGYLLLKHPKVGQKTLDFSGLSYDNIRDTIWITSDKGQCLFHYDWNRDQVIQRLDLTVDSGGKSLKIRKSEGLAIDPQRGRLYVVSERDGRLYVFRLHEQN